MTCKDCLHKELCEEIAQQAGFQDFECAVPNAEVRCEYFYGKTGRFQMTAEEAMAYALKELVKVRRSLFNARNKPGDNQQEVESLERKEAFWMHVMNTFEREMEDDK